MALFKIWRGSSEDLNALPLKDGYAYFTTKDYKFHIDFTDENNNLQRVTLNADLADFLKLDNENNISAQDILDKVGTLNPKEVTIAKVVLDASDWYLDNGEYKYYQDAQGIGGIYAKVSPLVVCAGTTTEEKLAYASLSKIEISDSVWIQYPDESYGYESSVQFYTNIKPTANISMYFISFGEVTQYYFNTNVYPQQPIIVPVLESATYAQERICYLKSFTKADWSAIDSQYEIVISADEHRCGPTVVPEVAAASSIGERVIYIGAPTSFGYVIKNSNEGKITLQSDIPFIGSLTVSGAAKADTYVKEFTYNDGRRIIINPEEHGLTGTLQVAFYIKDENGDYISSIGYTNSSYAAIYIDDTTNIVTIELDKAIDGKLILLGGNK